MSSRKWWVQQQAQCSSISTAIVAVYPYGSATDVFQVNPGLRQSREGARMPVVATC